MSNGHAKSKFLEDHPEVLRELELDPNGVFAPDNKFDHDADRSKVTLPEIRVSDRPMRDVSLDSILALKHANVPPTIFVRAGEMVHIVADESDRHSIKPVEAAYLRGRMDRAANYLRESRNGLQAVAPPKDVVNDILALEPAKWPLARLEALVEAPILRPDGTILNKLGYDSATNVFYVPTRGLSIPKIEERPTCADVERALALLNHALGEFPYKDQASRANTLGLALTPIVRMAISGQVPMALIDAPQAGTGKSLLANVVTLVTTGIQAAIMSAPRDEEEWRKALTATLICGTTVIIYDNLNYVLKSASLAAALTTAQWKDRILGVSRTVAVPQKATWIVTGNNIRLGGDLPRRCYWIRLDAQMSQPWRRSGFRHPDLMVWVIENRGKLLAALLTLARAWYAAGRPKVTVPHIGGFEDWTATIGGILACAGVVGFLSNAEELYEIADDTTSQWETFLEGLQSVYDSSSFTVAQVVEKLGSRGDLVERLPEELAAARGDKAPAGFSVKLGKAFRNRVNTRYGAKGLHLERGGKETRSGCVRWKVIAEVQGLQGSNLPKADDTGAADEETAGTDLLNLQPSGAGETMSSGAQNIADLPMGGSFPRQPCYCCRGESFRQLSGGGWLCNACHPDR